ncbi:MAG: hypothetical protein AABW53_00620 [Nanoarchaeota archaeon]
MNWNIIRVDIGWPLTKIEEPLIGSTISLSAALGLGLYNQQTNTGYLLAKLPFEGANAHDLLFPEIDGKIDGNPADYNVLLSGMRCLCQWERARVYDEAMRIDSQIDDVLAELGFNRKKIKRRYCGKRDLNHIDDYTEILPENYALERGEIVIDTREKLAEIRISDEILPSYSVYCRVRGIRRD